MRVLRTLFSILAIASAIGVAVVAVPQQESQNTFREGVDLVTISATVAGSKQHLVTNLSANDFAVYEDGKPQQIFAFTSGAENGPPLHVGVLLDVSTSQEPNLEFTKAAVIKFMASLSEAVDLTFIDFASDVRVNRFSQGNFFDLIEHVRDLRAGGNTALYDAIGRYLDGASGQDGRKVMVVYTDGGDTCSSVSLAEVMARLRTSDVTVYAIGAFGGQPRFAALAQGKLLSDVTAATGGRAFFPSGVKGLDRIYEQVLGEVRAQYTIGYVSTNKNADGAWRNVDIKIARADGKSLRVRARKGYYARSEF